jgi:hypothetical protein
MEYVSLVTIFVQSAVDCARQRRTIYNNALSVISPGDRAGLFAVGNFGMLVPIYADFEQGMVRLTQAAIVGNSTKTYKFKLDRQPKKIALNAYKEILQR